MGAPITAIQAGARLDNVRLDVEKQVVVDEDDAESFSEGELDEDLEELVEKNRDEKKQQRSKEQKKSAGATSIKHKKTDVNVFRLDLGNLAQEVQCFTGDPVICHHCGVMFDTYSTLTTISKNDIRAVQAEQAAAGAADSRQVRGPRRERAAGVGRRCRGRVVLEVQLLRRLHACRARRG